jgi:nucleoside diphosphate-linked moiety X motif protein 19
MASGLWRNSATLILAVRAAQPSKFDYNILMLKRSARSKFMPSAVVFPGGVTEAADFNPAWKQLLEPVKPLVSILTVFFLAENSPYKFYS